MKEKTIMPPFFQATIIKLVADSLIGQATEGKNMPHLPLEVMGELRLISRLAGEISESLLSEKNDED